MLCGALAVLCSDSLNTDWPYNGYPSITDIAHSSIDTLSQLITRMLSHQPVPLANPKFSHNPDPLINYSRSLHDYTLRLWTESRRLAEEKARANTDKKEADEHRERRESHQSKP
jgi:hypothetical protein